MADDAAGAHRDRQLLDANRCFYDSLWSGARLVEARRFNTWPLVHSLLPGSQRQLEVAPGLRPRLPLDHTRFVDISLPALRTLRSRGASAMLGMVSALPFASAAFDLVCTLDIVEHVDDDEAALAEIARVAAPGATLLLSAPLHPERWTAFDDFVGHRRRYEPAKLSAKLAQHGLIIERSAVYGMQPRSSRLLDLGMWWLTHHRERALWWYNRVFMPLGLLMQSDLVLEPGMIDLSSVDEVLLVCRKRGGETAAALH
ncbi:MAG TPA: methyltransferase domain-containing protein [Steroidobacteraceae bacterium]